MKRIRCDIFLIFTILFLTGAETFAQKLGEPLPVESVASFRAFETEIPIDLSPDGEWVAYTVSGGSSLSTAPKADISSSRELWLTSTRVSKTISLSKPNRSSWGGVWSPDGTRLAFFADWSGEAGLWVWEKTTRQAVQVSGVIVRPRIGFEVVRWTSDSRYVLCQILPEGTTAERANRLTPSQEVSKSPELDDNTPSVFVLKSSAEPTPSKPESAQVVEIKDEGNSNRSIADLALIEVNTAHVKRIATAIKSFWYSISPDEKYIAWSNFKGWERNSQQAVFDLHIYDVKTGDGRKLAVNTRMTYGASVSWSPDSRHLGFTTSGFGPRSPGECFLVSVNGGDPRKVGGTGHPHFGDPIRPPIWDASGENLYFLGAGNLWKIELKTDRAVEVAAIPNHRMTEIITSGKEGRFWHADRGRSIAVTTFDDKTMMSGIYKIDKTTGQHSKLIEESRHYRAGLCADVINDGVRVVFLAEDAQQPNDLWQADAEQKSIKRVTRINPDLDKYEMGASRLIEWRSVEGGELRGALLLPVGYQEGKHYPLLVWVYGGAYGSRYVNRFGLLGDSPVFNMQVLATRGYAVFYPDAPLREGTPMKDLLQTVMPGVNKAIELGIADPDQLAVMGQSYGSYSTLALITQTTRFKAAVITAVMDADLVGGYLFLNPDGTSGLIGYYEEGQGGMGGTLWQYPDRYIENSPVFSLDKVQTPLLMAHGTKDSFPFSGPDRIFVALRRLGKEVEYRQYENESHVIQRKSNVIDFWNRRLAWFDKYLKARNIESRKQ